MSKQFCLFIIVFLAGDPASWAGAKASPAPTPAPAMAVGWKKEWKGLPVVSVFYATDRNAVAQGTAVVFPDNSGQIPQTASLNCGTVTISLDIPYRRDSSGSSWVTYGAAVTCLAPLKSEDDLYQQAETTLSGMRGSNNDEKVKSFLFVHGFHCGFLDGVYAAAQIAYDLQLKFPPTAYCWDSVDSLSAEGYSTDKDQTVCNQATVEHLERFLLNYAERFHPGEVNLIAHSMGTYLLCEALLEIILDDSLTKEEKQDFYGKINSVILLAPDIGVGEFSCVQNNPSEPAPLKSCPVTNLGQNAFALLGQYFPGKFIVYTSPADIVLDASVRQLENHREARLGQSGQDLVVRQGLTTIDASDVAQYPTGFDLGHDRFSHDCVINDMYLYLNQDFKVGQRLLTPVEPGNDWVDPYDEKGVTYYKLFDGVHNIPALSDYDWLSFGLSNQFDFLSGDYTNELKLDLLIDNCKFQPEIIVTKGILPSAFDLRYNFSNGHWRPFVTLAYDFYDAGSGANQVLADDLRWGVGLEYVFSDGWGLGVGGDWLLANLYQTPNIASQSTINTLMNQVFPTGRVYFQASKYFEIHF